jgi:hypothetical protein
MNNIVTETDTRPNSSPKQCVVDMLGMRWKWSALVLAAQLKLADLLDTGPLTVEELAQATDTHAPSLLLLLNFLAYSGIFREVAPGRFAQTEMSASLCSDQPDSLYHLVLMQGRDWHTRAWDQLGYSISTEKAAFEAIHHEDIWHYFENHPTDKNLFDATMSSLSTMSNAALVAAYGFSDARRIVDVGGGNGAFLAALLNTNPQAYGILFDLVSATEKASSLLLSSGVSERCHIISGSFFDLVPAGGDIYILKQILHDWDDERALKVLRNCRMAMQTQSRLLIAEMASQVPPSPSSSALYPSFMPA